MEKPKGNREIVVRVTPEMANWMHPQTDKRREMIQKRVSAAKERFLQRKGLSSNTIDDFSHRVEIRIGSAPVVVRRLKSTAVMRVVSTNKFLKIKSNSKFPIHQGRRTKNR